MVCIQAQLLESQAEEGGLLSVLADSAFIADNADLFRNVHHAAHNSQKNVMFAGSKAAIKRLHEALQKRNVISVILPVDYAFHSPDIECIREAFLEACAHIQLTPPKIANFSAAASVQQEKITLETFWRAVREPVNFQQLLENRKFKDAILVDMSATGSLSGFIRQIPAARIRHTHTVNQFGNNLTTLHSAIEMMA